MRDLPTTDRRTALRTLGVLAGSGTALGAYVLHGSEPASADVTASLDVPDGSVEVEDGQAIPWAQVTGSWEYSNLDVDPDEWTLDIAVGQSNDNYDPLASLSGVPFGFDESKSFATQAPLTDAAAFVADDFSAPGDGQSIDVPVYMRVTFEVLANSEALVTATATDDGLVTVIDSSIVYDANVDASTSWAWQDNATDPTPQL